MKKIKNFLKEEKAAAQMIEAAIIYPIVFLIIFLMIYIGLYILQSITVGVYAQKIAILASREVSSPGYFTFIDNKQYSDSSVEMNGQVTSVDRNSVYNKGGFNRTDTGIIYRYWSLSGDKVFSKEGKEYYENALKNMVEKNSIIAPKHGVKVDISCENYVISQFINVKVEQPLMEFALLDFFGIKNPTVSATAKATVSDTDELVKNVDFVMDSLELLAKKLGIDVNKARDTIEGTCKKLGLLPE